MYLRRVEFCEVSASLHEFWVKRLVSGPAHRARQSDGKEIHFGGVAL